MHRIKSIYISLFITAACVGSVHAIRQLMLDWQSLAWWAALLACAAPVLFFARLFLAPMARTSPNLHWMPAVGLVSTVLAAATAGAAHASVGISLGVGVIGSLLYIHWYSRFDPAPAALAGGAQLPAFALTDAHGETVDSSSLGAALLMFYRGNWCPLCMAQIREVAAQYRELAQRGVQIYLISPQPEKNTAELAKKFDVPMQFMCDRDNAAAKALGIFAPGGLPAGLQALGYDSDVPRPTVLITGADGRIVYSDITENYRVRPDPAEYLAVLDELSGATAKP